MHNDKIHWINILNNIHLYKYRRLIVSYFNCASDATWAYGRGRKRRGGLKREGGGEVRTDTAAENSWLLSRQTAWAGGKGVCEPYKDLKYSE